MRLLLDTHVVYWWFMGHRHEFSDSVRELLTMETEVFVSPVTPLELLVKQARGKLRLPEGLVDDIQSDEFRELPIRHHHAAAAGGLPDIHRDPFDRFLIAQAQRENLAIVTRDAVIPKYDVEVVAV